jgi:CheY-like chemotaxis protein
LRIAKALADAANKAKSEFLSSMSHKLRTPLNAIIGFSQFIAEDEQDPLTKEQMECIEQVMKAGHHLLELIDDALDLSKIEIGAVTLSLEPVGVAEVVGECVELTTSMASRRSIRIEDRIGSAAPPAIHVDRTRFKQVLINFLSNAVKYNREGGSIVLDSAEPRPDVVRVSVTDSGDGIPEDKILGLFDPFDRQAAENSDIEGTGIGLTITKRLVEQMGGAIGVDSTPGDGSTFWVEFSIADDIADARQVAPIVDPVGEVDSAGGLVLYVEDNPANLRLMRKIMSRRSQFDLIDAPTAELGLELARQKQPDVIIMDINLPGMDGLTAVARLGDMRETRDIPAIALSAAAMPRDIERGLDAGFDDYLTKPVDSTFLMAAIGKALADT